jgi:type IV secretory pathway protease TraF
MLYGVLVLGGVVLAGWSAAMLRGRLPVIIYSPSPSLRQGWYIESWEQPATPDTGDVVYMRTPEVLKPYMPPDWPAHHLLKQVVAVAGMRVCWEPDAMIVETPDGFLKRYRLHADITARYPLGCAILTPDVLVVVGTHARSFDSRYVGPVNARLVDSVVVPLWTWEE